MKIYTCEPEWEAMLTTIYEASKSGLGHKNVRLMLEPIAQYSIFDEYEHIESNPIKAQKVIDSINLNISPYVYKMLALTSMAYEEDVLDNIYHVLILGFTYGSDILEMVQYKDVMRNQAIRTRVIREANRFREIMRFNRVGEIYVAHFEPKSRVLEYLGPVFQDRMPSENFMIIDDIHREAIVHKKDEQYYKWKPTESEYEELLKTERENDGFTDLWKVFYKSIAIKERKNEKCQMSHFPKWARAHAVEFN